MAVFVGLPYRAMMWRDRRRRAICGAVFMFANMRSRELRLIRLALRTSPRRRNGSRLDGRLRHRYRGAASPRHQHALDFNPRRSPVDSVAGIKLSFVSVWLWARVSIPLFRRVPEPQRTLEARDSDEKPIGRLRAGMGNIDELRGYRQAFLMLLVPAYNDASGIIRRLRFTAAEIGTI